MSPIQILIMKRAVLLGCLLIASFKYQLFNSGETCFIYFFDASVLKTLGHQECFLAPLLVWLALVF